jgi:ribosomal protein S18 acetylase RimI-like enzyme
VSLPPHRVARIRCATPDDAVRMGAIARAAYVKYVQRIGREPSPMLVDYPAEIAAGRAVVLELDGIVVGYMVAWPESDGYFIDNIGVDPQHQGQGLGRRLIDYAAAEARRLRLPALQLYTNEVMTENLSLYAHIGFVETHRVTEKGYRRVYMRWVLAAPGR